MTPEQLSDIKKRFPKITREEVELVPVEEFNKMCITHQETLIKDYKNMIQDIFKNSKDYINCDPEFLEWFKGFLRDEKNNLETRHKETVEEQRYLRDGLNPPFCYYPFTHRK